MELYKFQQEAVDKLGVPTITGRLLGDEMGLGKTVTVCKIDGELRRLTPKAPGAWRPTLIVAPLGVHDHWRRHILMFFPGAKIAVIDTKNRPRFVMQLKGMRYQFYICHYEALQDRLKDVSFLLRRVQWFHVVLDEVHRIKSPKAQQTRGAKELRAKYKTGASGTPADDKPQDLWSILNWLYPRAWTSYWRFLKTYCGIQKDVNKSGTTFRKAEGVIEENLPELHGLIRPYFVRRLKSQVQKQLPPKTYTTVWVDLGPKQRKVYDQMRKDMLAWVGEHEDKPLPAPVVIAQLVRLQQFALASPEVEWVERRNRTTGEIERKMKVTCVDPSTKLDALEELVADNPSQKFVVFTQSRSMVHLVAKRLARHGRVEQYLGGMPTNERNDAVKRFQSGGSRIFAGTIAAGGEAIELQYGCSTVVFLDRHWSPTKNVQAEDRVHRIGQLDGVQVIDIMARNTVDLGRRAKIASKWSALKLLLGDVVIPEEYEEAA